MKTITFSDWKNQAEAIRARSERLQLSIHERGWKLAASVGIPRDMCCLHNASIDTELKGWCKDNPERLKVAKRAARILNDWSATETGRRIVSRLFARVAH